MSSAANLATFIARVADGMILVATMDHMMEQGNSILSTHFSCLSLLCAAQLTSMHIILKRHARADMRCWLYVVCA